MDKSERKLEQLFGYLRQEDERRAPPFSRVWAKAGASLQKKRRRRLLVFRYAAVAAMVFIFLGSWFFYKNERPVTTLESGGAFSEWRSPTTRLLRLSTFKPPDTDVTRRRTSSISDWRSPTFSLTRPPDLDLL